MMRWRDDDKPFLLIGVLLVLVAVVSFIALLRCTQ